MALWRVEKMTIENGEFYGDEWAAICNLLDTDTGTTAQFVVPYRGEDLGTNPELILDALTTEGYTPNDWDTV